MSLLQNALDTLADEELRLATLVGLASVPCTIILTESPPSGDGIYIGGAVSGGALVLAGLVVGYLYSQRPTESRRAGIRTGLVGSIGLVLLYSYNTLTIVGTNSLEIDAIVVVLTLFAIVIGAGIAVLVVMVSARVGEWVAKN